MGHPSVHVLPAMAAVVYPPPRKRAFLAGRRPIGPGSLSSDERTTPTRPDTWSGSG